MKHLLTTIFFLIGVAASAQQETFFNQFWNNQTHYNPAFAGLEHKMQAGALYRSQWDGVNGAPDDLYAFYNMRLKDDWGLGINMDFGSIGFSRTLNFSIPASYRIQLSDKHTVALGAAAAFNHHSVDDGLIPPENEDDIFLITGSQQYLSAQSGIVYDNPWLTGSFSVRQIPITQLGGASGYNPVAHYYGMLRFKVPISGKAFDPDSRLFLEANYATDRVFSALQLNARVLWKGKLSLFGGYVWNNGIILGGGYDLYKKFRLNYSVTWIRNQLSSITDYTHEIAFVYQLPFED